MAAGWVGWTMGNVVAPLVVPIAVVFLVYLFADQAHKAKFSPLLTVKDGQLAWVALTFAISALYERDDGIRTHGLESSGVTLGLAIGAMVLSCLIPLCGLMFPTRKLSDHLKTTAWLAHYKIFLGSAVAAVVAGSTYLSVHLHWLH